MRMNKTHRLDAAAIAEQFGLDKPCVLLPTHTEDQASDVCTKRFEDANKWLRLLTRVNVIHDSFWTAPGYIQYLDGIFEHGFPRRTGGVQRPKVAYTDGVKVPKKKTNKKKNP